MLALILMFYLFDSSINRLRNRSVFAEVYYFFSNSTKRKMICPTLVTPGADPARQTAQVTLSGLTVTGRGVEAMRAARVLTRHAIDTGTTCCVTKKEESLK